MARISEMRFFLEPFGRYPIPYSGSLGMILNYVINIERDDEVKTLYSSKCHGTAVYLYSTCTLSSASYLHLFFPLVDLYVSLLGPGHLFVQYPSASEVSFVRRRCWQPSFYTDGDEAGVRDRAPTSLLQNKARVCGLVGSPGLPRPYKSCENITILVFLGIL